METSWVALSIRAYSHQRRAFFLLRKFCCGYIKKTHTSKKKWDPLADEVLEAA